MYNADKNEKYNRIPLFRLQIEPQRLIPVSMYGKELSPVQTYLFTRETSIWRSLVKDRRAQFAIVILVLFLLFALAGPVLSPFRFDQQIKGSENLLPSMKHWLGTDSLGRDLLTRMMAGAGISLLVGLIATIATMVIGSIYGAISGMMGGWVDHLMMRFVDFIYSIPDLLVIILLSVTLKRQLETYFGRMAVFRSIRLVGSSMVALLIVFALLYWVSSARIVRSCVQELMQMEFIVAAKAMGASRMRILLRHLLPNALGPIVVTATFQIPAAIFAESFLSFIGLGVSAPSTSLGSLLSDGMNGFYSYPHRLIGPAVLIALLILTFNLLGDALRDAQARENTADRKIKSPVQGAD